MRCSPPDLWDMLLPADDELVAKDMASRDLHSQTPWSPTAMKKAMQEWAAARLRWESVQCTAPVEAPMDFKAGRGRAPRQNVGKL
eukprot:4546487-Pyramimonas_sp.AAC.1